MNVIFCILFLAFVLCLFRLHWSCGLTANTGCCCCWQCMQETERCSNCARVRRCSIPSLQKSVCTCIPPLVFAYHHRGRSWLWENLMQQSMMVLLWEDIDYRLTGTHFISLCSNVDSTTYSHMSHCEIMQNDCHCACVRITRPRDLLLQRLLCTLAPTREP